VFPVALLPLETAFLALSEERHEVCGFPMKLGVDQNGQSLIWTHMVFHGRDFGPVRYHRDCILDRRTKPNCLFKVRISDPRGFPCSLKGNTPDTLSGHFLFNTTQPRFFAERGFPPHQNDRPIAFLKCVCFPLKRQQAPFFSNGNTSPGCRLQPLVGN